MGRWDLGLKGLPGLTLNASLYTGCTALKQDTAKEQGLRNAFMSMAVYDHSTKDLYTTYYYNAQQPCLTNAYAVFIGTVLSCKQDGEARYSSAQSSLGLGQ